MAVSVAPRSSLRRALLRYLTFLLCLPPLQYETLTQELGAATALNRELCTQLALYRRRVDDSVTAVEGIHRAATTAANEAPVAASVSELETAQSSADAAHELKGACAPLFRFERKGSPFSGFFLFGVPGSPHLLPSHRPTDLYELQRQRMAVEIADLRKERDAWFEASYALADVVASKNEMHTLRLLRLRQDSWRHLALQAVQLVKRASSRQLDGLRAVIVAFKAAVGGAMRLRKEKAIG